MPKSKLRTDDFLQGSVTGFSTSWMQRPESECYHFRRGEPKNQIQFAFQNHWRVFRKTIGPIKSGRILEIGCGRGSMGAFFADNEFEVNLLDTSLDALRIARKNFSDDCLSASFVCANALSLPFKDSTFDVVVSIGLFEHFAKIRPPLLEQIRVLRTGGVFLGYVVPERTLSVQTLAIPVNWLLRMGHGIYNLIRCVKKRNGLSQKAHLYRNTSTSADYLAILRDAGVRTMGSFGMFPVPMISHSPGFPFSLMAKPLELSLVRIWKILLSLRRDKEIDPWICPENWGLAFLVWAKR